jgi:photosystem II stability/assembly factor-like uncharacterized protein
MKTKLILLLFFAILESYSQTWQILPSVAVTQGRYEDLWFIDVHTGWVVENGGQKRILKTTNGGETFFQQFQLTEIDSMSFGFRSVAFNNPQLGWAGSTSGLLLRTTNGGTNWLRIDTIISPPPIGFCDISVVGDSVFYGSGRLNGPTNVIKSTNAGLTFENIDMGAYTNYQVGIYFFNKDSGFVAGRSNLISEGSVICFTSDGGKTWVKRYRSFIQSEHAWNITFVNSQVGYATIEKYIPGNGNIVKTTNGGVNWVRMDVSSVSGINLDPVGFSNVNKGWIANHVISGLWETTNGGINWSYTDIGNSIHGIFILNDTIGYACGKEVLKYTDKVVGIPDPNQNFIPYSNTLNANYPNPFNASTIITYMLVNRTTIVLEIYNSTGEFIEMLEHGYKNAGSYSVTWNAENYPSGVYFYSLRTDQGNYYGKAILVK